MKTISSSVIVLIMVLWTRQLQAQGTIYLSNLSGGQGVGAGAVASDAWLATLFLTGTNTEGYMLNSIQLDMANSSGNPAGFAVMLYTEAGNGLPGSSLGALDGSNNPATSGIYTYTDDSNIFLSPGTGYYIVLTAGTTMANGFYQWLNAGPSSSYDSSGGWLLSHRIYFSSDGSNWPLGAGQATEFAIDATAVPEPSSSFLLLLGSGIIIYARRIFNR